MCKFALSYAREYNVKLQVYTGTFGILHTTHKNKSHVPLYLTGDLKKIPIPGFIWKVLYDEKNMAGVAIIGVNDFFLKNKYIPICKDVSSMITSFDKNIRTYVYACTIEDLYKIVRHRFPNFQVERILGTNVYGPTSGDIPSTSAPEAKKHHGYTLNLKDLLIKFKKFFGF